MSLSWGLTVYSSVVSKMMAKSPDDRYQTPADVAAALEPFLLVDQPEREKSARLQQQPGRDRSRILHWTAVATLFFVAFTAGVVRYLAQVKRVDSFPIISGTSTGALVGSLACTQQWADLKKLYTHTKPENIINPNHPLARQILAVL